MMRSILLFTCFLALKVNAGSIDGLLKYNVRAPLPTAFVNPLGRRQDLEACSEVYGAFTSCEALNPSLATAGSDDLASCLCYEGSSWEPSVFDGQIKNCVNYAKTAASSVYSSISSLNGFCISAGDVRGAAVTQTSTTSRGSSSSGSGSGSGPLACGIAASVASSCASATSGFTLLPASDQAACLCYESTTWKPDVFDGVVQTCIDYVSTAVPTLYSEIILLQDFCTSAGNVLGPAPNTASITGPTTSGRLSATSTSFGTSTSIPTASGTALSAYPPCAYIGSTIEYCNAISPGYTTMEPSSQAPCVCYSSSTWVPDRFDRSASSCAEFVKTAQPSNYALFSDLGGFCTDVGDVLAKTTTSGSGSSSSRGSGGIGGLPSDVLLSTSTTTPSSTAQTPSTVTVKAPAATTSSANAGVRGVILNHWAEKLVIVFMVVLV